MTWGDWARSSERSSCRLVLDVSLLIFVKDFCLLRENIWWLVVCQIGAMYFVSCSVMNIQVSSLHCKQDLGKYFCYFLIKNYTIIGSNFAFVFASVDSAISKGIAEVFVVQRAVYAAILTTQLLCAGFWFLKQRWQHYWDTTEH